MVNSWIWTKFCCGLGKIYKTLEVRILLSNCILMFKVSCYLLKIYVQFPVFKWVKNFNFRIWWRNRNLISNEEFWKDIIFSLTNQSMFFFFFIYFKSQGIPQRHFSNCINEHQTRKSSKKCWLKKKKKQTKFDKKSIEYNSEMCIIYKLFRSFKKITPIAKS